MSTHKLMNKVDVVHIHSGISFIYQKKKKEILPFETKWMGIMVGKISQTEKDNYHMTSLICEIKNVKFTETKSSCQELKG